MAMAYGFGKGGANVAFACHDGSPLILGVEANETVVNASVFAMSRCAALNLRVLWRRCSANRVF